MYYKRKIQARIEKELFRGKVVIVYGPRRVGKTILSKEILKSYGKDGLYINCESTPNLSPLSSGDPKLMKELFGNAKIIVLDEAQKVKDIGSVLKLIVDTYPEIQIIATGSSSFDLSQKISEPLTGRARRFMLYPLSLVELGEAENENRFTIDSRLSKILIFGSYPSVVNSGDEEARIEIQEIAEQYLYRDALSFENIRKPELLKNLLQALALQVNNEVSLSELSNLLKCNIRTVERYIQILEESFIIFRLRALSRNARNEVVSTQKIYFYDLGIRNHLINAFNDINIRNDIGSLWENFCIAEKMRSNSNNGIIANYYFWRTYEQKEIDLIEEKDGAFKAYEFKWSGNSPRPKQFLENYPNSSFDVINKENYWDFIK